MALHPELARALEARRRKWGEHNAERIEQMHDDLVQLRKHPYQYRIVMKIAFGHRHAVGGGTYIATRSSSINTD